MIVKVQSKTLLCSRWLDGIAGSNPAGDICIRLLCMLCVEHVETSKRGRSLEKESHAECLSLSVIRRNDNTLHLL